MNAQPSAEFVWELPAEESDSHLSQVRGEASRALELEHGPLRLGCLLLAGIIYAVPLFLFQDQLLEAFAGLSEARAKLGVFILLGISTLVVLPLFGYLAHLSTESSALVEAARSYVGTVVPTSRRGYVQVRFSTPYGTDEVIIKTHHPTPIGTPLTVYAVPEASNLAAVELTRSHKKLLRIGQIA